MFSLIEYIFWSLDYMAQYHVSLVPQNILLKENHQGISYTGMYINSMVMMVLVDMMAGYCKSGSNNITCIAS